MSAKIKRFMEDCKTLIKVKSTPESGVEPISTVIQNLFADRGLKSQLQLVSHSNLGIPKRQFNVIGTCGDPLVDRRRKRGLLFFAPMDTAPAGSPKAWNETDSDPWNAKITDDGIFGLGAAQGKVDLVCKLYAMEKFRERRLKMPVYLVASSGTYSGRLGTRYLLESLQVNPEYAMISGPTQLSIGTRSLISQTMRVNVAFQGVERDARGFTRKTVLTALGKTSATASTENSLKDHALKKLSHLLESAMEAGFEIRMSRFQGGMNPHSSPDEGLVEFYQTAHQFEDFKRFFRDWTHENRNESSFKIEFGGTGDVGVRFLPESVVVTVLELLNRLDHPSLRWSMLIQNASDVQLVFDAVEKNQSDLDTVEKNILHELKEIETRFPMLNLSLSKDRPVPALETGESSDFLKLTQEALEGAGTVPTTESYPFPSDAGLFSTKGYPSLIFGPGKADGNLQSPNEFVSWDEAFRALFFYERLVEKVCL